MKRCITSSPATAGAPPPNLSAVPCLISDFNDEADVLRSMIAENTQRSDGLNTVDEAQALTAVIDLRQHRIGTQARRRSRSR